MGTDRTQGTGTECTCWLVEIENHQVVSPIEYIKYEQVKPGSQCK